MAEPLTQELLLPAEVKQLVGVSNPDEQSRLLREYGIPHRLFKQRILVSRFHVREWLTGRQPAPSRGVNLAAVK
jgi:hypothetical protein